MLAEFVKHIAFATRLPARKARAALGVVLNASERQGSPFAAEIYQRVPGARTLAAKTGAEVGAATGVIARLIEQTPGGRRAVAEQMLRSLQKQGLGHADIAALFPAISVFAECELAISGFGHLGDLVRPAAAEEVSSVRSVA